MIKSNGYLRGFTEQYSCFNRRVVLAFLASGLCVLLVGCNSETVMDERPQTVDIKNQAQQKHSESRIQPEFINVWPEQNLEFTYRNGREAGELAILETLGGGTAIFDYDRDGLLDLFYTGGGTFENKTVKGYPSILLRHTGEFRFFDITKKASMDLEAFYSNGCAVGDYDNDGFQDLLVTGYGGSIFWKNLGDGTFEEISIAAGLRDCFWGSSAGWGDLNGDGLLDLYLTQYADWSFQNHPECDLTPGVADVCSPHSFTGVKDLVFFNRGDGTFYDASEQVSLLPKGKGLGVILADLDHDTDLDIYVCNDTVENFLYLNNGQGKFEEVGFINGAAVDDLGTPNGSMGVDIMDYNQDGLTDLWVANYEKEAFALYRNDGDAQFLHVSNDTGVTSIGDLFVGFGTACADFDWDGDEDLIVANGHVAYFSTNSPFRQKPLYLENQNGRFAQIEYDDSSYLGQSHTGRGLALADFNNDGNLDVSISNFSDPPAILKNTTKTKGQWVSVRFIGRGSNRDAIGTRAVLHTSQGNLIRQIKGGGSYLSSSDFCLHWGVGEKVTLNGISIYWPSGVQQKWNSLKVNATNLILEPDSKNDLFKQ
ncbi:CRTAC1 family protein [Gimesia aquarii]|uniref:FG-GAP repeat protein n=1 Tax=Gimesia aquarii TaxID=2527964 RepID=A0A517X359_9PLAN|nr:CRTAC1 family protein [Gimesia aquarii]QDU11951.1 FG-GAP repeat protein [Gimesia aquarii]